MDETKTWWFKAIAKHAHGLFAVLWGMGLGNFLAVVFKAVDVSGYALTFYLAITTALMAGLLSVISSRAMDALADRRAIRRRLFNARTLVAQLIYELEQMKAEFDEIRAVPGRTVTTSGSTLTDKEAMGVLVRCGRISQRASEVPNFEDLVESQADSIMESVSRSNFIHCKHAYAVPPTSTLSREERLRRAADYLLHTRPAGSDHSPGHALSIVLSYIDARLGVEQ